MVPSSLCRCCQRRRGVPGDAGVSLLQSTCNTDACLKSGDGNDRANSAERESGVSQARLASLLGNMPPGGIGGCGDLPSDDDDDAADVDPGPSDAELIAAREVACKLFIKAFENACGSDPALCVKLIDDATAAEINTLDDVDRSTLLLAAMEGHVNVCRALLARSDFNGVNSRDMIGSTALHFAAGNDHVDVCRLLLASPRFTPGVNAENHNGKTPLDFSIEFGEGETTDVIRSAGGQSGGRAPRKGRRHEVQRGVVHREPDIDNNMDDLD